MPEQKTRSMYQFKITLRGSKPPIWRRFIAPDATTLPRLHDIIQTVMGWTDCHLHEFIAGNVAYGVPDPDWPSDMKNEARVRIHSLVNKEKQKILYLYDFGDGWEHVLELEKIVAVDKAASKPRCLAGKRACPPEDCGGIFGYLDLLEAIKDPRHPEHDSFMEWLGGDFDPEAFDIQEVNEMLSRLR